jgi:hypothetical protein
VEKRFGRHVQRSRAATRKRGERNLRLNSEFKTCVGASCQDLSTRKTFFDDLRALTRYMLLANWDA